LAAAVAVFPKETVEMVEIQYFLQLPQLVVAVVVWG
jgi:hypothetical protein